MQNNGSSAPKVSSAKRLPRLLFVEDNADTRRLVGHLLRKRFEVLFARDGEEALAMAMESPVEILLLDINLGRGKSGEEVMHILKSRHGYTEIPFVVVTAYALPGDRERYLKEGFDEYVSKPFSKQRLFEAIENAMARKHAV